MTAILNKPDTHQKLSILSDDAKYDIACACGSKKEEHRKRSKSNQSKWIYPVTLQNGGRSSIFKTLVSNVCESDCAYCPLRHDQDIRRVALTPEEIVQTFLDYYQQGEVFGLFLSSGLFGTADTAMTRLIDTASILRKKHKFRGMIHLKILPGASPEAIEQALSLASAVSINIETPGPEYMKKISSRKDYLNDIIAPIRLISQLTRNNSRYRRVKQTTQFIVGAAGESDREIVHYSAALYNRLRLNRIYFSAYQRGPGDVSSPAVNTTADNTNPLTREHRLYQVDFLFRKYGFRESDIPFSESGQLDMTTDPKQIWANNNPDFFPVNLNTASRLDMLKVPGLGPITVNRILQRRKEARLTDIRHLGRYTKTLQKAQNYLTFS